MPEWLRITLELLLNIFLTVTIEGFVAFFFGKRNKFDQLIIMFVNIASNFILNVIFYSIINFAAIVPGTFGSYAILISLEIVAVLVEAVIFNKALLPKDRFPYYLLMSFVMNLVSFTAGLLIYTVI